MDENNNAPTQIPSVVLMQKSTSPDNLSKWSTGKTTMFLMTLFYLFALIIAIIHFLLFQYLDGKLSDTKLHSLSQTYITTASNLLAYLFGNTLKISLAIAFAQHLWWTMRRSAMKVSAIEVLFNIRSNPLQLFYIDVSLIKQAWVLILLAVVLYIIPIASSFPPGALTVKSASIVRTAISPVLTYNASYVGNGSLGDAMSTSISPWGFNIHFTSNSTWAAFLVSAAGNEDIGSLQRLSSAVINTGNYIPMASPCGNNCSYEIQFMGPVFQCYSSVKDIEVSNSSSIGDAVAWNQAALELEDSSPLPSGIIGNSSNTTTNTALSIIRAPPLFFQGTWELPGVLPTVFTPVLNDTTSQSEYTEASFSTTTLNSTSIFTPPVIVTESNLSCIPSRALYTVQNSYVNNTQNLTYTVGPPIQLLNTLRPAFLNGTYSGTPSPDYPWGGLLGNWSDETLAWYRDSQLLTLTQQIAILLTGSYITVMSYSNDSGVLLQRGSLLGGSGFAYSTVGNSRLNTAFQDYDISQSQNEVSVPSFNVTEEALNKMLGDLTISTMVVYGIWSENVNVTQFPSENIYTFSRPINLVVPYLLSLALSLPFLLFGFFALYKNGVPAADGGFIQILTTTTGSPTLQKAAAANCLGAGGEVSKELQDLEVQFGELVALRATSEGREVKRAGFGTKSEIGPLLKGDSYGYT